MRLTHLITSLFIIAILALSGCAEAPLEPTPTATEIPAPTITPFPTEKPVPTDTPAPTADPDLNAGILFTQAGSPDEKLIALTIDDFYQDDVIYYWLVDYLRENPDVKLTMFPVGARIQEIERMFPGIWKEWYAAGHEFGWHSMTHDDFGSKTADDLRKDLDDFTQELRIVLDDPEYTLRWARAPFGNYGPDPSHFEVIAEEYGLTWVLWGPIPSHGNADPLEWESSIQNGDISLFHVRWQDQYWLERYVSFVRNRGFEMATLSAMTLVVDTKLSAETTGY